MKKGAYCLLAFIALVHITGLTPFYHYALAAIKSEMRHALLSQQQAPVLTVSDEEWNNAAVFQLIESGELVYYGAKYDYSSLVKIKGGYLIRAIKDVKETALLDVLNNLLEGTDTRDSDTGQHELFKHIVKEYLGRYETCSTAPSVRPALLTFNRPLFYNCMHHPAVITAPPDGLHYL